MSIELDLLADEIRNCQRCPLRMGATQPVPGLGPDKVKYVLIGEAPGREEDENGIPFCGLSGKRLDKLVHLAGLDINEVYLTNVCRCRPPDNRTPKKKEIAACVPFLYRELHLLCPEYIITLGRTPLELFSTSGVSSMHGTLIDVEVPYK